MICRIYANAHGNREHVAKEMMFGFRDAFDYFQCAECGCLQIARFPDDMSRYYPASYYSLGRVTRRPDPSIGIKSWARVRRDKFAVLRRGLLGRLLYLISPNRQLTEAVMEHFPGNGIALVRLR